MRLIFLCVPFSVLAACGSQGEPAFECPDLPAVEAATTIREDPGRIAGLVAGVVGGTSEGIRASLDELARSHPEVSADERVDYLLAISCPAIVGEGDLPDDAKTRRFEETSERLEAATSTP